MTDKLNTIAEALEEIWTPAITDMLDRQFELHAAFEGVSVAELQERQALASKRARRIDRRIRSLILRISRRLVLTWRTLLHGEPQDWDYQMASLPSPCAACGLHAEDPQPDPPFLFGDIPLYVCRYVPAGTVYMR